MVCPRCGADVTVFRLGDAVTRSCVDCEYVGISVDHRSESDHSESWDTALSRFRDFSDDQTNGSGDDTLAPQSWQADDSVESDELPLADTDTNSSATTAESSDRSAGDDSKGPGQTDGSNSPNETSDPDTHEDSTNAGDPDTQRATPSATDSEGCDDTSDSSSSSSSADSDSSDSLTDSDGGTDIDDSEANRQSGDGDANANG